MLRPHAPLRSGRSRAGGKGQPGGDLVVPVTGLRPWGPARQAHPANESLGAQLPTRPDPVVEESSSQLRTHARRAQFIQEYPSGRVRPDLLNILRCERGLERTRDIRLDLRALDIDHAAIVTGLAGIMRRLGDEEGARRIE